MDRSFARKVLALLLFAFSTIHVCTSQVVKKSQDTVNNAILDSAFKTIVTNYVDEVNTDSLLISGMNAMLGKLDPFSFFVSPKEAAEYAIMLSGKFGGLGYTLRPGGDYIVVREVYEGYPAAKAGILPGDTIMAVNGIPVKGIHIDRVVDSMRGDPGSNVTVTFKRPGQSPVSKNIAREVVNISSVPYYGIIEGDVAYIRLLSFTNTSGDDVKSALTEMRARNNIRAVVLDLRDNTGGYMREAIKIANLFLDKGTRILSVRSKSSDSVYVTMNDPIDTKIPLAVLTNKNTVSSAEILSGALQDNDRAVIVGQPTFGKGLVQNIFGLNNGAQVWLTIAYYYTPSGRCIQKLQHAGIKRYNSSATADNTGVFKTLSGRALSDHGGITPDIKTEPYTPSALLTNLQRNDVLYEYVAKNRIMRPGINPTDSIRLTSDEYLQFVRFAMGKKWSYNHPLYEKFTELKESAMKDGDWQLMKPSFDKLEQQIKTDREKELLENKAEISRAIAHEIALQYNYRRGFYKSLTLGDHEVRKAVEVLRDRNGYSKILGFGR